jgi:hypothetical protein
MRFAALFIVFPWALLTGCGAESAYRPEDLRPASDLGFASDMGFIPSDAAMLNDANLIAPAAWASLVPLDSNFQFDVNLPRPPAELEGYFSIVQRPAGTALAGAFSWKGSSGVYKLTFIPSAKLADASDFEVLIDGPLLSKPKVGVSTGSHPRVRHLQLDASGSTDLVLTMGFSEPMKDSSFVGKIEITYDSPRKAATINNFTKIDASTFKLTIPGGQVLAEPITLILKPGVQGMTGTALDPKSWDSPTDAMGNFEHELYGAGAQFVPEVQ